MVMQIMVVGASCTALRITLFGMCSVFLHSAITLLGRTCSRPSVDVVYTWSAGLVVQIVAGGATLATAVEYHSLTTSAHDIHMMRV